MKAFNVTVGQAFSPFLADYTCIGVRAGKVQQLLTSDVESTLGALSFKFYLELCLLMMVRADVGASPI